MTYTNVEATDGYLCILSNKTKSICHCNIDILYPLQGPPECSQLSKRSRNSAFIFYEASSIKPCWYNNKPFYIISNKTGVEFLLKQDLNICFINSLNPLALNLNLKVQKKRTLNQDVFRYFVDYTILYYQPRGNPLLYLEILVFPLDEIWWQHY